MPTRLLIAALYLWTTGRIPRGRVVWLARDPDKPAAHVDWYLV